MKEMPMLYSTPMIKAKLAGRKTQTRRLKGFENVNAHVGKPLRLVGDSRTRDFPRPAIKYDDRIWFWWSEGLSTFDATYAVRCPYKPGDVLWSRETWFPTRFDYKDWLICSDLSCIRYKADGNYDPHRDCVGRSWKPSIHMPKGAARIWERITDIRVERLQDISEGDAIAEGVQENICKDPSTCPSILKHKNGGCCGKGEWFNYLDKNQEGEPCYSAIESYRSLWESINGPGSWGDQYVWVITTEILSTTGRPKSL